MQDDVLVNAIDIARMADVGRAAVSNWRKRFDDFPQPVGGTASSPAFSLSEVEQWLRDHGRYVEVSPLERFWQRLRSSTDDLRLAEVVAEVGAVLLGESAKLDDALAKEAREIGQAEGSTAVFDGICERYVDLHSRRLQATPPAVAKLMTTIASTKGGKVLDPACGIGTILLETHGNQVSGQELNENAARLASVRLRLHGYEAQVEAGDSLRGDAFAGTQFDVVVCNPPFNERGWGYDELTSDPRWEFGLPPRGESELAWVQHCLAHVKPGGLVVIMMPSAAANRRPGRRIRGNLLRAGTLRAIISLFPGAAPASSGSPDLWVLRKPAGVDEPQSDVLMVNAGEDLALAERAWRSYCEKAELPENSRVVRIIDLLDEEVDLTTGHRVVTRGSTSGYLVMSDRLSSVVEELRLPRITATSRRDLAMTILGELARAGVVTIMQGPLKLPEGGELPLLTAKDLLLNREPTGSTSDAPGLVRIEKGDVIASLFLSSGALPRVMTHAGAALGSQLLLFRTDPERLDPYFLAGCLRAEGATGSPHGSTLRRDPRRASLPRLPIEEQRRYGKSFAQLLALEDTARALREISDNLVVAGIAGLLDGSLTPE
ncbi:N-6 DNA methylase [Nonomuraea sp. NN258]|uniref:N-6 DNA methylase n=1 Tax=Nonomuraea antri TaxID=2730852 RepID=UPI001569F834|nr:N-6 DNA methylase [Nonomuraea antri]NRQ30634.1 N-6 DNA methylase [Nonomuraea antri]